MTVLFVDFDDAPATKSVDSIFSIINPIVPNFFKETSYGRMELNLKPHLNFIQEAVDLAHEKVNFSEKYSILVISSPEAKATGKETINSNFGFYYNVS